MSEIKCVWPGWAIVKEIGRGSFGSVYEIRREVSGFEETAAMKVMSIPGNSSDIETLRSDGYDDLSITAYLKDWLSHIESEYVLMATLKGHPNIVHCEDFVVVPHEESIGWDIYIRMELLTPLKKAIAAGVSEEDVIKLGISMCRALDSCAEANIIHRDIKPENIFVSRDGTYKLGDFGIAKNSEGTSGGTKTGTYGYMAPEVFNNRPYGRSADQYSLGLVMYWMLNEKTEPFCERTGIRPTPSVLANARGRRMGGEPVPAPVHGSDALKQIVLKACAYNPADRFRSPAEMQSALEKLMYTGGAAAVNVSTRSTLASPQDDLAAQIASIHAQQAAAKAKSEQNIDQLYKKEMKTAPVGDRAVSGNGNRAVGTTAAPNITRTVSSAPSKKKAPVAVIIVAVVAVLGIAAAAVWFFARGGSSNNSGMVGNVSSSNQNSSSTGGQTSDTQQGAVPDRAVNVFNRFVVDQPWDELYIRRAGSDDWGNSRIAQPIDVGGGVEMTFSGSATFDIYIVSGTQEFYYYNVDVSNADQVYTDGMAALVVEASGQRTVYQSEA